MDMEKPLEVAKKAAISFPVYHPPQQPKPERRRELGETGAALLTRERPRALIGVEGSDG